MKNEKIFNVFFDTEFTDIHPLVTPNLISIGCVAQDGRELYVELLDTWATHQCSQFVVGTVLPLLDNKEFIKEADLAVKLRNWVESLGDGEVVFRSDSPSYDWGFVADLFNFYGCWPKNMRRRCGTIYWENQQLQHRYDAGMASYWKEHSARQHHALVDARSMQFAWKYAIRKAVRQ